LAQAVKDQLVADVPLGAFLSGGIDSSLVVHYMAQAGASPLKTFSVRFAEAGFDESPAARAVAELYGTEHHVLDAPQLTADALAAALADLDQPLADPAYIPTWALSRLTRQHVTVALSGDGGDELFGGYPRFLDIADRHPDSTAKRLLRAMLRHGLAPASLTRRALAGADLLLYRRVELGDYPGSRKDLRRYLAPELAAASRPQATLEVWRDLASRHGNYDRGALLRADLWTYLSENCLTKTDRASMAHGLEVRVPLLANALQDRMLRLPASVHFDAGGGKALLRALARRHLPDAVWNREKHGFSVPLRANFAGPWREWAETQVAATEHRAPWLDATAIATLWQEARRRKGNVRLMYTFAVLLAWLEKHPLDLT
jgi:asparagine synthase (glutamine-hydrolysing)